MEKMDRKKKKEVKGDDDHYIGEKKRNGDGRVLSWENDSQLVDNLEGKKKRKKNKDKASKKERDECAVSGHAAENKLGDAYLGEMEINGEKGVMVEEHVELKKSKKKKKKKEKEQRSEKERDEYRSSGHAAENELDEMDIGDHEVAEEHVELKKKKKKEKKKRSAKGRDEYRCSGHVVENYIGETEIATGDVKDGENCEVLEEHGVGLKAKTKKRKKEKSANGSKDGEKGSDVQGLGTPEESLDVDIIEKFKKNRKLKKGKSNNDSEREEIPDGNFAEQDINKTTRKKKRKREKEKTDDDSSGVVVTGESLDKEVPEEVGRKKRKTGSGKNKKLAKDHILCEGSSTIEMESNDGEMKINNNGEEKKKKQPAKTKAKKGKKKVSFSSEVEVFHVSSDSRNQTRNNEQANLVRGKRFTPEEDKILEEAVHNYIEAKRLGEEGLYMVRHCKSHPEVKGCWIEIAKALPHRPQNAVYCRAQILLNRGEKCKWSEEDCELLRKLQEKHGNNWKLIAEEIGRNRYHVKDTWRRLNVIDKQKGQWSQNEYQNLFDLVNTDLRLKISEDEEKKKKHGMLRDNIHWTAISDTLAKRSAPNCCIKWYDQLSSPMVAEGVWADSDDYHLINELFTLDASCMEDVDWDNLLDHRSGDICRKRWNQMVFHIGNHVSKSFFEQVEILARRYNPDLIEVREAWENKPFVD